MNEEKKNNKGDPLATPEIYYDENSTIPWDSPPQKLKDERSSAIIDDDGDENDNSDIKVVNELATMDDDTTLPCLTLRAVLVGSVSY